MLEAGAEVLETDTFQASRLKLVRVGSRGPHVRDQPEGGRDRAQGRRRAPLRGRLDRPDRVPAGQRRPDARADPVPASCRRCSTEQAHALVKGGADLIIIETAQDILEVKAAIFGAREAFKQTGRAVPIQCSVSLLPQGGKMLLGTDISAVLATLEALDVDVIGLNCSTGPEDMRDAIRFLGENCSVPVHCIPNAGLPLQGPNGETIFPEQPEPLANVLGEFVERYGVTIVGGCCGTTPDAHRGDRRARPRAQAGANARPRAAAAHLEHDRGDAAGPGPAPDAGRRARQLAGLAQGQGAAAGRRLRRPADRRRGPGHRRRPRARRVRRADRAPGRGRADAPGRQADLAHASRRRSRSTRPSPT